MVFIVRGKMESISPDGSKAQFHDGDVCGEELLTRYLEHSLVNRGFFLTKIFLPNIATSGEICVNTLKKDWNPSIGLRHILLVVRCLLIEPFPESALNEQAGKMLLENYSSLGMTSIGMTSMHGMQGYISMHSSLRTSRRVELFLSQPQL